MAPTRIIAALATVGLVPGCYASVVPGDASQDATSDASLDAIVEDSSMAYDSGTEAPSFESSCISLAVLPSLGQLAIRGREAIVAYSNDADDPHHTIVVFRDGRWQTVVDHDASPMSGSEPLGFALEASSTGIWEWRAAGPCGVARIESTSSITCAAWISPVTAIDVDETFPLVATTRTGVLSISPVETAQVVRFTEANGLYGPVEDVDCVFGSCALATHDGVWMLELALRSFQRVASSSFGAASVARSTLDPSSFAYVDFQRSVFVARGDTTTRVLDVVDECDRFAPMPDVRYAEDAYWLRTSHAIARIAGSRVDVVHDSHCDDAQRLLDAHPGAQGTYYRLSTSDDAACRGLVVRRVFGEL